MKLKKIFFLTLMISLLILTSCSTDLNSYRVHYVAPDAVNYFTGTKAVTIEFSPQAPPDELYEGSKFDVQAIIHNEGAYDVVNNEKIKLDLIVDSSSAIDLTKGDKNSPYIKNKGYVQLYGKSYRFPKGESDIFPIGRYQASDIIGNFLKNQITFYGTLCYPYRTYFSDEVCIDTSSGRLDVRKQVCKRKDKTYSGGQGAPVEITAVKSEMVPIGAYVEPRFMIDIKQVGDGIVSLYDSENKDKYTCENINPETVNKLQLKVTLGDRELDCTPNPVFFTDGKATIECVLPNSQILSTAMNYYSNLNVELRYLYMENFEKTISVKRKDNALFSNFVNDSNYSECAPWQIKNEKTQECENLCTYCSEQAELGKNDDPKCEVTDKSSFGKTKKFNEYFTCNYDYASCVSADSHCILENSKFCPPGMYCGEPRCAYKTTANHAPRVGLEEGIEKGSIIFYCSDLDNSKDLISACGCDKTAEFAVLKKSLTSCRSNNLTYKSVKEDGFSSGLMKTYYTLTEGKDYNSKTDKAICLKVEDKQGKTQVRKVYLNCDNNLNACFR